MSSELILLIAGGVAAAGLWAFIGYQAVLLVRDVRSMVRTEKLQGRR